MDFNLIDIEYCYSTHNLRSFSYTVYRQLRPNFYNKSLYYQKQKYCKYKHVIGEMQQKGNDKMIKGKITKMK